MVRRARVRRLVRLLLSALILGFLLIGPLLLLVLSQENSPFAQAASEAVFHVRDA